MSHFSKIQTRIHDIVILKKTLSSLGFRNNSSSNQLEDEKGKIYHVDLIVQPSEKALTMQPIGFIWDGLQYNIVTDLAHWPSKGLFDFFLEKLNQQYSLNVILDRTVKDGFQKIEQRVLKDGSMKVIVQKWN